MARPKKEVTPENLEFLLSYLRRALIAPVKPGTLKGGPLSSALNDLNKPAKDRIHAVQTWINTWLTDKARQRMWAALRQQRYKEIHSVKMVALTDKAYSMLSDYANHHKVTLSQAVECLLEESVQDIKK